jgi:hypothetical protein
VLTIGWVRRLADEFDFGIRHLLELGMRQVWPIGSVEPGPEVDASDDLDEERPSADLLEELTLEGMGPLLPGSSNPPGNALRPNSSVSITVAVSPEKHAHRTLLTSLSTGGSGSKTKRILLEPHIVSCTEEGRG